jgi:hypothetical protein
LRIGTSCLKQIENPLKRILQPIVVIILKLFDDVARGPPQPWVPQPFALFAKAGIPLTSHCTNLEMPFATATLGAPSIAYVAIHRRAALTSRSDDCHETPPNAVDIPVSRFAISETFMGGLLPLLSS